MVCVVAVKPIFTKNFLIFQGPPPLVFFEIPMPTIVYNMKFLSCLALSCLAHLPQSCLAHFIHMINLILPTFIVSKFFALFFCKNVLLIINLLDLSFLIRLPLGYIDQLQTGEGQVHAEILTALQSNIEDKADAFIKDEIAEITKVLIRLFLIYLKHLKNHF